MESQPLTVFTVPKAFRGHIGTIQRNAIRSWTLLRPSCEIILLGDDQGAAEAAGELGVRHIPNVARNEYGTPLLDTVFQEAEAAAGLPYLCYVNADIILMSDFLEAVGRVLESQRRFLLVGRRTNLDIRESLDFEGNWDVQLRDRIRREGRLHGHTGIDYFVFPRGLWGEVPAFALGRGVWDNWLIYRATTSGVPVVDLTEAAQVVHQNHDYSHLTGVQKVFWKGPESKRNLELAGGYASDLTSSAGYARLYTIWDARFKLTRKGIRRRVSPYYLYRRLVSLSESYRSLKWLLKVVRQPLGWIR